MLLLFKLRRLEYSIGLIVLISADNESPDFETCPSVVAEGVPCGTPAVVVWPELQAHDNSGETIISCNYESGAEFAIGNTLVECRAIDGSGNEKGCDFTVSVAESCGVCLKTFQNYEYYFFCTPDSGVSFANAETACQGMGADLASIHSQDEMDFIAGYTYTREDGLEYWIGFIDYDLTKNYVWTDGTAVDYTNWKPGEPTGESEHCGLIAPARYNQWNDVPCSIDRGYLCKKYIG